MSNNPKLHHKTYDKLNRKTTTSYLSDSSLNESYEYDQGANAKVKGYGDNDNSPIIPTVSVQ